MQSIFLPVLCWKDIVKKNIR